jgi:tRNA nucleotidyltransferase/poly(A) polymerase
MIFDNKKFQSKLPSSFFPILDEFLNHGFRPTFVGGVVRDYFLKNEIVSDWDIELYHSSISFEKGAWKDLGKKISRFGKVTYLPYEVIRLELNSYHLEISPPRREYFKANLKNHSNFDAEFVFNLPFSEAVLRRDFTINAIGIRFQNNSTSELLDPLDGLRHLREKRLHFAGPDFSKDPVRFLRAHRFANKLKFSFSPELKLILDSMSLEGITPSYVWSEMKKTTDPVHFMSFLVQEKNLELKLPVDKTFTTKVSEIKKVLTDPRKLETWVIALEWVDISSENWVKYFSMSTDLTKRLARWAKMSRDFQLKLPEAFHGEFEEIKNADQFEKLFNWYFTTKQLLQKNSDLPLMKMIEEYLPNWIHLYRFELPKDVKHIDPPFRAKYQVWNLCQRL